MGFPYEEASWNAADGAMFMGWGTAMPGFYTFIAMAICAGVLIFGHMSEKKRSSKFEK